jgi:hypothetical protein
VGPPTNRYRRFSLARIDPFSLCAIIPALALAGLCGASGFTPGVFAMVALALAIVLLEVWVHRRELPPPPPRAQRAAAPPTAVRRPPPRQYTEAPPRRQPGAMPRQQPPPRPRVR